MKVRKQQIPETVHILNIPLTADIDKHDDDNALNNILMTVILLCSYSHSTQTQAQC